MANYKRNDGYTIRVTKEEFYAGGNSDPRNPNILKMFGFVNVGERAGSGVDKIMTAWAEQNWEKPEFDFSERSDRVTLKLEVGQGLPLIGQWVYICIKRIGQRRQLMNEKFYALLEYLEMIKHWEIVYGKETENDRKQL